MNDRPIGLKPGYDVDSGQYLCPNDLLLGRSTVNHQWREFDTSFNPIRRLKCIQGIIDSFWKRWKRDYFHTLLIRQKWHVTKRDLCEGDVVMMKESNALKDHWRLALVHKVHPGADGRIRNVTVSYKILQDGDKYKGTKDTFVKRSVHNLVLVVPVDKHDMS